MIFFLNCEIGEIIGHHLDKEATSKTFPIVEEDEEDRLNCNSCYDHMSLLVHQWDPIPIVVPCEALFPKDLVWLLRYRSNRIPRVRHTNNGV